MVLKKDATLFERDEKGELIPQKVELIVDEDDFEQAELKGEEIVITPMTRGELKRMLADLTMIAEKRGKASLEERRKMDEDPETDYDRKLILEHCVDPKYSEEDVKFLKNGVVTAIINTILFQSGLDTRRKSRREALREKEDEFAKN